MILIRLYDSSEDSALLAALRRELKRQKATILVDKIDVNNWRTIEARAR